jgi:hypothetical protein
MKGLLLFYRLFMLCLLPSAEYIHLHAYGARLRHILRDRVYCLLYEAGIPHILMLFDMVVEKKTVHVVFKYIYSLYIGRSDATPPPPSHHRPISQLIPGNLI